MIMGAFATIDLQMLQLCLYKKNPNFLMIWASRCLLNKAPLSENESAPEDGFTVAPTRR